MCFIVDECTGPLVAGWLAEKGNDVISVFDEMRGADDFHILKMASRAKRILITNDKDFGELVYKQGYRHNGIVLLRLEDESAKNKIACLKNLLNNYEDKLKNNFVVVTEKTIRITRR